MDTTLQSGAQAARDLLALSDTSLTGPLAGDSRAQIERLTQLLARVFKVPYCLISSFSATHQLVLAGCGLPSGTQTPRSDSICLGSFQSGEPLLVADAREDARLATNIFVTGDFGLRFYGGVPLRTSAGEILGVMCLIDTVPRPDFSAEHLQVLQDVAGVVAHDLEMRSRREALLAERTLFAQGPTAAVVWEAVDDFRLVYRSDNLGQVVGNAQVALLEEGKHFDELIHPSDRQDFRTAMRSHLITGLQELEISYRMRQPDGSVRWVRQATRVATRGEGRPMHIHAYLTDETRQKRLESSVAAAKDRLFLAIQSARLGTWDLDLMTMERMLSARSAEIIGFPLEEIDVHQDFWLDRVHPYDRAALSAMSNNEGARNADGTLVLEYRIRHREGHYVWVQSYAKVVESDAKGRARRVVGTLKDITDRKREESHRNRQRLLLDVLNQAQAGFLLTRDMHDACEGVFDPLLKLTDSKFGFIGIMRTEESGRPYLLVPTISNISWDAGSEAVYGRHRDREEGLRFYDLDNLFGHVVTADTTVCTNDPSSHPASRGFPPGHPRLTSFLGLPIRFNGRVMGMIGLGNRPDGYDDDLVALLEPLVNTLGALVHARDLDLARQRAEAELQRRATTDALTGLANRRAFIDAATAAMARAERSKQPLTLAVVDLDHFKRVNDTHGHNAGDEVLRRFAVVAQAAVRDVDLVARLGGEEFAVLLHDSALSDAAVPLQRLRRALEATEVSYPGGRVRVTMSAGMARWSGEGADINEWLAAADRALYAAKEAGRNAVWLDGTPPTPAPDTVGSDDATEAAPAAEPAGTPAVQCEMDGWTSAA